MRWLFFDRGAGKATEKGPMIPREGKLRIIRPTAEIR
jgi:hypothetical protein